MSAPNTPLMGPFLAVMGQQQLISRAQAVLDWSMLQRFLGTNIPTAGVDAVASGADPTGQVDSTAALQNILNQGGTLFLRAGTYKLSGPLTITGQCLIYCESQAVFQMTANFDCIQATNCVTLFIRGVRFEAFLPNTSKALNISVTTLGTSKFYWISECSFHNWTVAISMTKIQLAFISSSFFTANNNDLTFTNSINIVLTSLVFPAGAVATGLGATCQVENCIGLDDFSYVWQVPQAVAYQTSGQVYATGVGAAIIFQATSINTRLVWDPAQPTRFTAPVDGFYLASAQAFFTTSTTGLAQAIQVDVNGTFTTPVFLTQYIMGSSPTSLSITALLPLVAGDYVEFILTQVSGSNKTTNPSITWGALTRLNG